MLADPRPPTGASLATPAALALYGLAERSLAATTGQESSRCDERIDAMLRAAIASRDGAALAAIFAHAPSLDVHRHLWRVLAKRAGDPAADGATLSVRLFAIPLVLVAGMARAAEARATLAGVVADPAKLADLLREHGALGGNRNFVLGDALVKAEAIDLDRLPGLVQAAARAGAEPLDLAPAPVGVTGGEAAHLRFLVGSALAAPGTGILAAQDTGRWSLPFARALMAELAVPDVSLVVLPRAPMSLPAAVMQGRSAQREIAAQLFASNALRELRASVGEPTAVISAHVATDAPGGGELRLSLSSPLSPRDAQGFRCPLYAGERVDDVATMLVDLLQDCRVSDVRLLSGIHPDRDPLTGGPLMFKPDTLPPLAGVALH